MQDGIEIIPFSNICRSKCPGLKVNTIITTLYDNQNEGILLYWGNILTLYSLYTLYSLTCKEELDGRSLPPSCLYVKAGAGMQLVWLSIKMESRESN